MAAHEVDELFRRFAGQRDVAAVGELFDRAAPQLARVAWHLVHDAAEVEDLVQATFLTALDSVAAFDARRPVMPWLLGILVRHAHNARRAAGRRPGALEQDVVDPRVEPSQLERGELRSAVERAVADLPDTYRDVVARWLLAGEAPQEIATSLGKPAATVRVQLHRGLELLRRGLPPAIAGWLAPSGELFAQHASIRANVVAHAASVSATLAAATVAPVGAWIAGSLVVLALAGAAAVGIALWPPDEGATASSSTAAVVESSASRSATIGEPEAGGLRSAGGEPAPRVAVASADSIGPPPVSAPELDTREVTGRVLVPSGFDVARTIAALFAFDDHERIEPVPVGEIRCEGDGAFRLRSKSHGRHVLALALPGLRPQTRVVEARAEGCVELGAVFLDYGEHLAGTVRGGAGAYLVTAEWNSRPKGRSLRVSPAEVQLPGAWWRMGFVDGRFEWVSAAVLGDELGAFRIEGLAPVEHALAADPRLPLGGGEGEEPAIAMLPSSPRSSALPSRDDVVVVFPTLYEVRLDLRCGGIGVAGASVRLGLDARRAAESATGSSTCRILWSGDTPVHVRVWKEDVGAAEFTLASADSGTTRIVELVPE